jgi:hypothetical protein
VDKEQQEQPAPAPPPAAASPRDCTALKKEIQSYETVLNNDVKMVMEDISKYQTDLIQHKPPNVIEHDLKVIAKGFELVNADKEVLSETEQLWVQCCAQNPTWFAQLQHSGEFEA